MTLLGYDCYSGNADALVTSYINKPEVNFIIHKASEGQRTTDSKVAARRLEVQAAGKRFGTYHFAWPLQDPNIEADNYLAAAKPEPGEVMALDMEKSDDGATWAQRVTYALAWLAKVQKATGAKPFVYVNASWRDSLKAACSAAQWSVLKTFPLWLAHYKTPYTPGVVPTDLADWRMTIHQFTSVWNGDSADGDWFPNNFNQWDALAIPQPEVITMTAAEYTALMTRVTALSTDLNAVRSSVSAMQPSVSRTESLATAIQSQVNSVSNGLSSVQSIIGEILAYVNDSPTQHTAVLAELEAIKIGIEDSSTAEVVAAVKSALNGFQVTMKFPQE